MRRVKAAVLLLYILLSLLFFHNAFSGRRVRIIGDMEKEHGGDLQGGLWVEWFMKHCLENGDLPTRTDLLHHPFGKNLLLSMGNFIPHALGIPLSYLFPYPQQHNYIVLLFTALNAFSMFLLMNFCYRNLPLAFVSGGIFAFSPFLLREISAGRTLQFTVFFIPLSILFFIRYITGERRAAVPGLLFTLLVFLSYWFYGIFLYLFLIPFLAFRTHAAWRDGIGWAILRRGILFILLASILVLPFGLPFLLQKEEREVKGVIPYGRSVLDADFDHQVISSFEREAWDPASLILSGGRFDLKALLSTLLIFSVIVPSLIRAKKSPFFISLFLVYSALAMGPFLVFNGRTYLPFFPMPYELLFRFVPFFSRLHFPARFTLLSTIIFIFLFSELLLLLMARPPFSARFKYPLLASSLLVGVVVMPILRGLFPFPYGTFSPSPFYYTLKDMAGKGVIEVPFGQTNYDIMYQPIHGKYMFGAVGERAGFLYSYEYNDFIERNTFVKFLGYPDRERYDREDFDFFLNHGYSYIILNRRPFMIKDGNYEGNMRANRRLLEKLERHFGPPFYTDHDIAVFRIREG